MVPPVILTIIDRVIEARKDCGAYFKANEEVEDRGHNYFVNTLQQVHDKLKPCTVISSVIGSTDGNSAQVENLFEHLVVEEPSRDFLDSPVQPRPDHTVGRMLCEFADTFLECVGGYLEESFAASALFRDINKLYIHSRRVWEQYKSGDIDLTTASVLSNSAIDLIRRLEEDFFASFPKFRHIEHEILKDHKRYDPSHDDAQQLINFMFRAKCKSKGVECGNTNKGSSDEISAPFNLELYDEARYLYLDLLAICAIHWQGSQCMTKSVYWPDRRLGGWVPNDDHNSSAPAEKFRQDTRILLELFPDMLLLSTSASGIPALAEDEMLRGMRQYAAPKEGKISPTCHLWQLVSFRIFCDIHHILGYEIGKPFEAVRRLGMEANEAISECIRKRDSGECECWPAMADEEIKAATVDRIQQSLFVDEVKDFIDNAARNVLGWKGKTSFELLRRHPSLCGLMEFNIRACMEEVGILSLEATRTGTTISHLYNALQKEGTCSSLWPDMETFIDLIGEDCLFHGERPSNPEQYAKRLLLIRGLSVETFARGRRGRGMITSKKGPRSLLPGHRLVDILKSLFVLVSRRPEVTNEETRRALEDMKEQLEKEYHFVRSNKKISVRILNSSEVRPRNNSRTGSQVYSPEELLLSLQFGLLRELPKLFFDYLGFHRLCWMILKHVYDMCEPFFVEYMPTQLMTLPHTSSIRLSMSVELTLIMGLPLITAQQMIRKSTLPNMPLLTSAYQTLFNQGAILADIGRLLENKIANGRLRNKKNVGARRLISAVPKQMIYELDDSDHKLILNKQTIWKHTSTNCTKDRCVCEGKPTPMMKSGWRHDFAKAAMAASTK